MCENVAPPKYRDTLVFGNRRKCIRKGDFNFNVGFFDSVLFFSIMPAGGGSNAPLYTRVRDNISRMALAHCRDQILQLSTPHIKRKLISYSRIRGGNPCNNFCPSRFSQVCSDFYFLQTQICTENVDFILTCAAVCV